MIKVTIHDYRKKVGAAIRTERRDLDLTQGQLSDSTGIAVRTISRIESGNYTKDIKLVTIQKLCSHLGISVSLTLGQT